jgi:hypothetical protein
MERGDPDSTVLVAGHQHTVCSAEVLAEPVSHATSLRPSDRTADAVVGSHPVATEYTKFVRLEDGHGGAADGNAVIDDLDADAWQGTVTLRTGARWSAGPVAVRLLESDRREETARANADTGAAVDTITLNGLSAFTLYESN